MRWNYDGINVTTSGGTVTTTDATVTTILTLAISSNTSGHLRVRVKARNYSSGDTVAFVATIAVKNASGTASVGTLSLDALGGLGTSLDDADVTVTASSGNVLVRVTGIAATAVVWTAVAEVF